MCVPVRPRDCVGVFLVPCPQRKNLVALCYTSASRKIATHTPNEASVEQIRQWMSLNPPPYHPKDRLRREPSLALLSTTHTTISQPTPMKRSIWSWSEGDNSNLRTPTPMEKISPLLIGGGRASFRGSCTRLSPILSTGISFVGCLMGGVGPYWTRSCWRR